ncbi:hypothetical protein C2E23DRAFT_724914 [Lenzites betulinus]|nr:hypothetical protein C2E23DRAFT_724914 [Lenzites betulinus]
MAQASKRTARKPKVPSASLKNTRQALAKHVQTSKKQSKAQARISQSQVADATAQINGDFAQVQSLLVDSERPQEAPHPSLPENTIQDLTDVMKDL